MFGMHSHYAVNGGQGRVLLVDDEEAIRKPIVLSLRNAGYDVVEAEDGEQAIRALNAGDNPLMVDTILCDLRVPKINGTEAITDFRKQYPNVSDDHFASLTYTDLGEFMFSGQIRSWENPNYA